MRDRARFLKGLLNAAGIGGVGATKARLELGEEEFRKGVQVEEFGGEGGGEEGEGEEGEKRTLTGDQVKTVLFEGKSVNDGGEFALASSTIWHSFSAFADFSARSTQPELGTFSLALPTKRLLFSSSDPTRSISLPPYPTSVPPSSIRDVLGPASAPTSRSPTPMRGFGSDSIARGGVGAGVGSGRASPVVLVPTNFANAEASRSSSPASFVGAGGRKAGFRDLEDFYKDEESEEDEDGESEEEQDSGEEEESGEDESGSGEEESGSEEEESGEESEEEEEKALKDGSQ